MWFYIRSAGVWSQQGDKMVGTGSVVVSNFVKQGLAVALSADGNTAIVGGPFDNAQFGAAWVFTRTASTWSQQGNKLVGTGATATSGFVDQGYSVALSADGNTALVGGFRDNGDFGAAWVFIRSGGGWSQQGDKLVGTNAIGNANQGWSVALSGDGNTAIVGGIRDNAELGAAWVYTRSNLGVWSQQGTKLVGTGAVNAGFVQQGSAVALSADGNTAIVGGSSDNGFIGATWVFTRSGTTWTQQGNKLVGGGVTGQPFQGEGVALSADGNTAIVGGPGDNTSIGAMWIFTRAGTVWGQEGNKLVGTGNTGASLQGQSVALSADGTTAIVGGYGDNASNGAAWVFARPGTSLTATHDFNHDGKSDILFRNSSTGAVVGWLMNAGAVTASATIATVPTSWQIVAQRDFDGDGKTDILWRDGDTGTVKLWLMNGLAVAQVLTVASNVSSNFVIAGVGDFNGDGKADILWRNMNTGTVSIWLMNGGTVTQVGNVGTVALNWSIIGATANGGIGWRNSSGALTFWKMNGFTVAHTFSLGTVPNVWSVVGIGDFDGNGNDDLLFRNSSTGAVSIWFLTNGAVTSTASLGTVPAAYSVDLTGDFNGDGKSDIVWTHTSGARSIWFMNGATAASIASLGTVASAWVIQSNSAE